MGGQIGARDLMSTVIANRDVIEMSLGKSSD